MAESSEQDVARAISSTLRSEAAKLPPDSHLRAMALRSASRWDVLGDLRAPALRVVR